MKIFTLNYNTLHIQGTLQPTAVALNTSSSLGSHNNLISQKTRLNSYEESLSSPESGFSNRSRVSSGEDDLGEIQAWNCNVKNTAENPKSSADWTYIAVTPCNSEESIPINTNSSSFKSVVSNLLPPGAAIVNGENDFDPSLTELNAILEGKMKSNTFLNLIEKTVFPRRYFSLPNNSAGWNKTAGWQNLKIDKSAGWNKATQVGILGILLL